VVFLIDDGLKSTPDWACNVCGSAQLKPKTPEEIQARQQSEAHSQLTSAIALWGLAHNRDWNPTELNAATKAATLP